jgi:hypothetical protein
MASEAESDITAIHLYHGIISSTLHILKLFCGSYSQLHNNVVY